MTALYALSIVTMIIIIVCLYIDYLNNEAAKRRAYDPRKERKE